MGHYAWKLKVHLAVNNSVLLLTVGKVYYEYASYADKILLHNKGMRILFQINKGDEKYTEWTCRCTDVLQNQYAPT